MPRSKIQYRHWLPEEERELRLLYEEGLTISEIAKKRIFLGRRTEKAISEKLYSLDRKDFLKLERRKKLMPEMIERIFSLREEGKTIPEIGRILRLPTGTVSTTLYRI